MIDPESLIFLAGVAHIALSLGSLLIPRLLSWKQHLSSLPNLYRQMFWVYATYTFGTNIFFGIISITSSRELINDSSLSASITAFIALYWIGRVLIQFIYFDRKSAPSGTVYVIGEIALVTLFILFSLIYSYAFYINIQ